MAKETQVQQSGGVGASGLLGVVFVTLKLCHVIDWNWWWVTVPFWGPLALLAAGFMLFAGFTILKELLT